MSKPNEDLVFGVRNLIATSLTSQSISHELTSMIVQQSYTISEMAKRIEKLEHDNEGFKKMYDRDIHVINLSVLSLMSSVNAISSQSPETLVSMGLSRYVNV
jgi:hypothetical protein